MTLVLDRPVLIKFILDQGCQSAHTSRCLLHLNRCEPNRVNQPAAADYIVPPCHESVDILYADPHLLLVNKPSGLLSVPSKHPANRDCLITRLQQDYPQARIVHRLDLDTSGLMVVALDADTHRALNRQFEQRQVTKEYQAVVYGRVAAQQDLIDLPLICDWPNRPKQKVDHEHGKSAQTRYQVLETEEDRTRLRLMPITGRSHQLRVHLMAIGHPILGCDFYAHPQALAMAPRLLLHATRLEFSHPVTGESVKGFSDVPF